MIKTIPCPEASPHNKLLQSMLKNCTAILGAILDPKFVLNYCSIFCKQGCVSQNIN